MLQFDTSQPLLVFGGPYSNLEATIALRRIADDLAIPAHRVICTGDVVAYCAEPEETASLIREWGCHVIQGNCEQQIADEAEDCACNFEEGSACALLAKGWYPFANARVSDINRTWMKQLPQSLRFRMAGLNFRVVHGGLHQVNRWVFASDEAVLREELALAADADVIIAGHAGVPFIERISKQVWFNPGVIGMPANDGTADVWYGLIRVAGGKLTLSTHRLGYDHHSAAAGMRKWGYANGYARALVTGLWPSLDVFPARERAATGRRLRPRTLSISLREAPDTLAGQYA